MDTFKEFIVGEAVDEVKFVGMPKLRWKKDSKYPGKAYLVGCFPNVYKNPINHSTDEDFIAVVERNDGRKYGGAQCQKRNLTSEMGFFVFVYSNPSLELSEIFGVKTVDKIPDEIRKSLVSFLKAKDSDFMCYNRSVKPADIAIPKIPAGIAKFLSQE